MAQSKNVKKNFFDFEEDEAELYLSLEGESKTSHGAHQEEAKKTSLTTTTTTTTSTTSSHVASSEQTSSSNKADLSLVVFENNLEDAERKVGEVLSTLCYLKQPPPGLTSSPTRSSASNYTTRLCIERLLDGDINVNLTPFRAKEQKLELLDYSLISANTYVITKIILFLRDTLKPSLFAYEMSRRPVAANHYLLYLRNTEQTDELFKALAQLGRNEEAAFAQYARAVHPTSNSSGESRIRALNRALQGFTSGEPEMSQWLGYIRDQITLLEQQLPIEADDARREAEEKEKEASSSSGGNIGPSHSFASGSGLFVLHPRQPLVGLPVLQTLFYCCLYHYHLQDNNFASPVFLKKKFGLSEKQYLHTCVQALAKVGGWVEIDALFEYKSWLGSRKIKTSIPTLDIVYALYKNSAPQEMLEKYLDLVDDVEKRLQVAKEFRMTRFAADILIKLRDRKRLAELRNSIQTATEVDYVQKYIENAIKTSTIKWRN